MPNSRRSVIPRTESDRTIYSFHSSFSPNGKWLATAAGQLNVYIWDANSYKLLWTLSVPDGENHFVCRVLFSPDSRQLAAACTKTSTVSLWSMDSRTETAEFQIAGNGLTTMIYSPDGKFIVLPRNLAEIDFFNATDGKLNRAVRHVGTVTALAISPDGKKLALADEARIEIYDLTDASIDKPIK